MPSIEPIIGSREKEKTVRTGYPATILLRVHFHNDSLVKYASESLILSSRRIRSVTKGVAEFIDGRPWRVKMLNNMSIERGPLLTSRLAFEYNEDGLLKAVELATNGQSIAVSIDYSNYTIAVSVSGKDSILSGNDTLKFLTLLKNLKDHVAVELVNKTDENGKRLYSFQISINLVYNNSNLDISLKAELGLTVETPFPRIAYSVKEDVAFLEVTAKAGADTAVVRASNETFQYACSSDMSSNSE